MMKRLRLVFSLTALLVCLVLSSVSVLADEAVDINDLYGTAQTQQETTLSAEDQKTFAGGKIKMADAKQLVEQYASAVGQYAEGSSDELEYLGEYFSYQTDMFENFAKTVGDDPCGKYKSYDDVNVKETEDGKVDVTAMLHFAKRDLKMTMHVSLFDTLGPVATSVEFGLPDSGKETIGQRMADAGVNTLIGMGTVFVILIFISLLISCFKFIPMLMERKEKKKANSNNDTDNAIVQEYNANAGGDIVDDTELIAVIAAAIAASENTSTDSFVVKSIRRR